MPPCSPKIIFYSNLVPPQFILTNLVQTSRVIKRACPWWQVLFLSQKSHERKSRILFQIGIKSRTPIHFRLCLSAFHHSLFLLSFCLICRVPWIFFPKNPIQSLKLPKTQCDFLHSSLVIVVGPSHTHSFHQYSNNERIYWRMKKKNSSQFTDLIVTLT